ncbi:FG-GAP repeat domain-containing protein [Streptomyces ossamyceticus]|uniref:FG-GAP repeat domain-containing protein n=1 Tax=Streptomyces ossamyceticus TaxID=249581 RepID=UPI0034204DE1
MTEDFDEDTNTDLAIANLEDGTASVLLGNGDGTFDAKVDYATDSAPLSIESADFDGDSAVDLVTANGTGTVSVLPGNGDGTFGGKGDYYVAASAFSVAVGDFNEDSRPDVTTAIYETDEVSVLLNTTS